MKKLFSYKNKKQRGVALVFTLGILGLLTVVALGFASTALINRKVAENCANISYAQTIARSIALPRAMFAVRNIASLEQFYSTSTDPKTYDWLWKLDTSLHGVQLFKYQYTAVVDSTTNAVDWVYVRDSSDDPNSNGGRILGRYAYVVIPDKGRLDPSVNIAHGDTIDGASETQIGINNSTWSDLLKAAITASPNYRWTTFWEIFNKLGIVKGSSDWDKWVDFFQDGVNIGQLKYPEAYWVDGDSDAKKDSGELYRRFNLNRSDWETLTVAELIGSGDTTFNSADTVDIMKGIPWLNAWSYSHDNWTADLMKKQIAANIIQYNRADTADTVSDSADWMTTAPTYAGVGKHPMLNEVGFKLNTQATLTAASYDTGTEIVYDYTLTYAFNVSFGTELIDMFQKLSTATDRKIAEITLPSWSFNATYTWISGGSPQTFNSFGQFQGAVTDTSFNSSSEVTVGKVQTIDGSVWWNVPYTPSTSFWQEYNVTKTFSFRINSSTDFSDQIKNLLKIKNISVVPGTAVLKYDSRQRDFAILPNSSADSTEYDATVESNFTYALETTDPRVNHYSTDWTPVPSSTPVMTTTDPNDYKGTKGACNSTVSGTIHAANRDIGTTSDPGYGIDDKRISSAFIRHGTMQSVWELGCISRAEAWRTLNLTRTNNAATPDYTYEKGDGKILDQVKLTDSTRPEGPNFKYGKVNINSDVTQVFQALTDTTIPPTYSLPRFPWFNSDFETSNPDQKTLLDVAGTSLNVIPSPPPPDPSPIIPTTYPHASNCECLACLIQKRSKILPFNNRSELLMDAADVANLHGYSTWDLTKQSTLSTLHAKIRARMLSPLQYMASPPPNSDSNTKAAQEQLLGKLMPLLRAETSDVVYVIVLAQTIRDIGGTPAFIDWNGDGDYSDTFNDSSSFDLTAMKKAGYVRTGETTSSVSSVSVQETYNTTDTHIGTYEIGADKITSEAKLIAVLVQDPVTRKWRIARYQYVE
ncbi:MAG: hypothetical protein BWY31_01889 [Lentisphaerae bacterium ADurb.Bin242]|nr:MAG: hypothetical protein BWY31_01889 [Lentisphaerae bacterium ADurb.Bin242]